jgi:hypothetical protein
MQLEPEHSGAAQPAASGANVPRSSLFGPDVVQVRQ